MRKNHYIGAASGWGAKIRTCEDGPDLLKSDNWEMLYPKVRFKEKEISLKDAFPLIIDLNHRITGSVEKAMKRGDFPVVVGGDHSVAVGTWTGVGHHFGKQPLGLIWIDAHMDSHTPETTPSGAWHGMPLAALMGYGAKEWAAPIIKPEHLCLIGTRSFEEGEMKLLERLNVRIYYMEEVKKRGFQTVLREAIARVSKGTIGYGASLDIDVVDPIDAQGFGSPEPEGIRAKELLQGLTLLSIDPHLKAFEFVEFNPHLDREGKTLKLCKNILSTVLSHE